jgi:hypothetical protein
MWSTDGAQIVAEGRRDVSGLTSPLSGHSIARFCSERARGPTWAARVDVPEVDVPVEDGVPLAVLLVLVALLSPAVTGLGGGQRLGSALRPSPGSRRPTATAPPRQIGARGF